MRNLWISILCLLALSLTWGALADSTPGGMFREFVRDMVAAGAHSTSHEQSQAMRHAFAKHPEIIEWLAQGSDFGQLVRDADLPELESDAIKYTEFRNKMKSTGWRLLDFNPALKNAISDVSRQVLNSAALNFSNIGEQRRMALLEKVPDAPYNLVSQEISNEITANKLSESKAIQLLTSGEEALKVDSIPGLKPKMVLAYIAGYFNELPLEDKRQIVVEVLGLPPHAPVEKQLSAMLHASGPGIQKFLQLVGRDAKSPMVQKVMKELLAGVQPFSGDLSRKVIETAQGRPIEKMFSSFEDKPIAAGTIGQVHQATLRNGQRVVVKVRRPGIKERATREMAVLRKISVGTPFEHISDKIEQSLNDELDFKIEAANLEKGKSYKSPEMGLSIAERAKAFPAKEDVLVTRLAPGSNFSSMTDSRLLERGKALSKIIERWFEEALFGSGFFHSDLHPGNIFLKLHPETKPGFTATLIDFGNSGELTLSQRRAFVLLALGAIRKSPGQMLNALSKTTTLSPKQETAILQAARSMNWAELNLSGRIQTFLAIAVREGIDVPSDLLNFNRGKIFLEGQLADINSRLDKADPERKLSRFDPTRIYAKVAAKRIGLDFSKQLFSRKARQNSVIPVNDFIHTLEGRFSTAQNCTVRQLGSLLSRD